MLSIKIYKLHSLQAEYSNCHSIVYWLLAWLECTPSQSSCSENIAAKAHIFFQCYKSFIGLQTKADSLHVFLII